MSHRSATKVTPQCKFYRFFAVGQVSGNMIFMGRKVGQIRLEPVGYGFTGLPSNCRMCVSKM